MAGQRTQRGKHLGIVGIASLDLQAIALGDHQRDLEDVDGIQAQAVTVQRSIRFDLGCGNI